MLQRRSSCPPDRRWLCGGRLAAAPYGSHGVSAPAPGVLRMERRVGERVPAMGSLVVSYSDGEGTAGVTRLELIDSDGDGLGALSPTELSPGMIVGIGHGVGGAPAARGSGVVARCTRDGAGWRVGLRLGARRAA